MRVLVTGGSGFIGRHLVEDLIPDFEVLAPRHPELDLLDEAAVARWLEAHRVDAVVHTATRPGHRNASGATGLLDANTRMFTNLTRRPDHIGKLVVLTTGAVYDPRHYAPKMPEARLGKHVPVDEASYSKYLCARLTERYPGAVELRPFGVYGPHEDWEIRFISNATCKALHGLPITLRQNRRFDYVWVKDLVEVVRAALRGALPAGAYNVTPNASEELLRIAELVRELSGRGVEIRVGQPGLGLEYSGDNGRLRAALPGLHFTSLREGVTSLRDWYAARLDRIDRTKLLVDK